MGDIADWTIEQGMEDEMWLGTQPTRYIRKQIRRVVTETENAWLVEDKRGHQRWYPKSVCTLGGKTLSVPNWIKPKRVMPARQHANTIISHL